MDEAADVIARLERIEELRAGGPPGALLAELRALVPTFAPRVWLPLAKRR